MKAFDLLAGQGIETASGDAGWNRIAPALPCVWAEQDCRERKKRRSGGLFIAASSNHHGEVQLNRLVAPEGTGIPQVRQPY